MKNLELLNLTQSRFAEVKDYVIKLINDPKLIDSESYIEQCIVLRKSKYEEDTALKLALEVELKEKTDELRITVDDSNFVSIRNIHGVEISKAIKNELNNLKIAIDIVNDLKTNLVGLPDDFVLSNLELDIKVITENYDRAIYARNEEAVFNAVADKTQKDLEKAKGVLENNKLHLKRLNKAIDVLTKLRSDHSLESATEKSLVAIRSQINGVFEKIHSPREYVISDSNSHFLTTRFGKKPHDVSEISTGQRAALALSIFLALNYSAVNAPKVLLIDDPVAHIDDLNILAFIDYLRDLTLHSNRQIFFATADSKVAALFDKKFEFMGTEQYKKIKIMRSFASEF